MKFGDEEEVELKTTVNIIDNEKLTSFIKEVVIDRKVFNYKSLKLN